MKILIISMAFPYPTKAGGKLRVYNLIREVSKYHEIYLISLIYKDEIEYIPEMLKFCKQVEVVPFEHTRFSKMTRWLRIFTSLFTKTPVEMAAKESRSMQKKVNEIITNEFDIIQVEWLQMTQYLPFDQLKNIPLILVEHDVSYVPWQRRIQTEKGLLKYIARREFSKVKNYERKICQNFDKIIVMSEIDKNRLSMLHKNLDIRVVPNGVDTENIQATVKREDANSLLFIGWMRHQPNRDAMNFFLDQIFPLISKAIPNTKLYVVGQHTPKNIVNLAKSNPNIICTGYVKDVGEYLYNCTTYICPLRIAGGTRLKILEAMAAGIPVVSTSIGAEGLNVTADENILIADTPEEFAEMTIRLLRNPELRERIAYNARIFVEENYQWKKIAENMIGVYKEVIRRKQ
ncbi:D-inositol-3-phosphate glycosyltransferase [subsurface metagenome]